MKVVLVFPKYTNLNELSDWWYPPKSKKQGDPTLPPLGLLYLHSSLKDRHEVFVIDNMVEKLEDDVLIERCLEYKPKVVGFGGTMLQWPQASRVSLLLKKRDAGIVTIYGGPNATSRPEKHVEYFDFVFRGMAEETLSLFLHQLSTDKNLDGIEGLCWRGHLVSPCLSLDLDKFPFPSRKQLKWKFYRRSSILLPSPTDSVLSSRGCPYVCRFCSSKHIWNRNWFPRGVKNVMKEIEWLKNEMGTKSIHFREDNFTVNKQRLQDFCENLAKIGLPWICQSRVGAIDENTVQMMKDAGCRMISCGFESVNDGTLSYVRKGQTAAQVRRAIDVFEKVGMYYTGAFIVATPNENAEDIQNNIRFAKEASKYPYSKLPSYACRFVGMPVSELYWEVQEQGLVEYDWQNGEMLFPGTKYLSSKEVDKVIEDCGSPSRP